MIANPSMEIIKSMTPTDTLTLELPVCNDANSTVNEHITLNLKLGADGLTITPQGYDHSGGEPILIEHRNGKLMIYGWTDPDIEEPTFSESLDKLKR